MKHIHGKDLEAHMTKQAHRLAVLVSGSGTLLEHMISEGLPIDHVIADKPCRGLRLAKKARVKRIEFFREDYGWDQARQWSDQPNFNREGFSEGLASSLNERGITVAAMAGFMTILSPGFFSVFEGVLLNIHPALLPAFKGEKAVQDALDAGVKITGTTIHIATLELDAGPIIEQEAVRVMDDDTVDSLHERIKQVERPLYARVLRELLGGTRILPPH